MNEDTNATATLAAMKTQLDGLAAQMSFLVERQRKSEELFAEMTPVLREAMGVATERLDELEKRGYFAFGSELFGLLDRVVRGFTPEDVRELGDAIVSILETVRALTQPDVLAIAGEASHALENAGKAEPLGIVGMVRATRDDDVQKGMAVMMDLMRHVGRAAQLVNKKRGGSPMAQRRAKLDGITGSRRSRRVLGVERPPVRHDTASASGPAVARNSAASCAAPRAPSGPATVLDGVAFNADGHMVDADAWTRDLGQRIALAQGVSLSDAHWAVVELARKDFLATKSSPNIRRLTQISGMATKELYALFPKAPARTVAKIAGAPKPAGCI